jgi:uncharacterized protein YbaA (DUF1428 family)
MGYVDLYLLPIPEGRTEEYRAQASAFGAVAREHGALRYREFRADDLDEGFAGSAGDGQLLTAAVVDFESRAHRDAVMEKVMADPRVAAMADADPIADMEQMRYGGFETFVEA